MIRDYPPAERVDVREDLCGHSIADPYRWLENAREGKAAEWSAAQGEVWHEVSSGLGDSAFVQGRIRHLTPGGVGLPVLAAGRVFYTRRSAHQDHPTLVVAELGPDGRPGAGRVVFDPVDADASGRTTLDLWAPSWDGKLVALVTSEGGQEQGELHVAEVDTGEAVESPITLGRGPDIAWLAGSEAFLYVRRLPQVPKGEEQLHRRVWRHVVGGPISKDDCILGDGRDPRTYYGLHTHLGGSVAILSAAVGTEPRNDLWYADTADPVGPIELVDLAVGRDALTDASVGPDGRVWLLTDDGAPRGRILLADLSGGERREVVAESDQTITGFAVTDHALVVTRMDGVVATVSVHDPTTAEPVATVDLDTKGSAVVTDGGRSGPDVWIHHGDSLSVGRVTRYDTASGQTSRWVDPDWAPPPPRGAMAMRLYATSADGTQIPYEVVGRGIEGGETAGARPTILYGYGGFGVSTTPTWSSTSMAWVEAGGLWIDANLRGGGEFGEDWHKAGRREHKTAVFEDFEAVAADVCARGLTDPDHLGIWGGSNGGLLVGAALVRHPESYAAVVCSAPLLDMVRYEHFGLGATWSDEYGSASVCEELGWLLSYSPYHHVQPGVAYPATLFTVFEGDTRVDTMHARKMCAALQWATSAPIQDRPIALRSETGVGHSSRSVSRSVALSADELGFMGRQLGLDLGGAPPEP